jgi:5-methylthioadenosine/S-adenosylhomocysteine deaminase
VKRILLEEGLILTLDRGNRLLHDHDLLIEGDQIAAIGKDLEPSSRNIADCEIINAKGKLIMPGLINAHFHSYDAFMKGRFEDLPLEIWALHMDLSQYRPYTDDELHIRTLLVASEMIRNGITTMHDNVTLTPLTRKAIDAVMNAYLESGVRAYVGATVKNLSPLQLYHGAAAGRGSRGLKETGGQPSGWMGETITLLRESVSQWNGRDGRVWVSLAPSAPQRCSQDFLSSLNNLSAELQIPISTHVLETKVQVVVGLALYGKSIVQYLNDIGFLSKRLTIHHGVWLNDDDLELLAENDVSIVHNPVANLRLRSGIAPVRKMLNYGINVALGCDNHSDNDSQNIFEAMKFAALLPEGEGPAIAAWNPAEEVLKMATLGGARSVLCEDSIGSIAVGKKADLILLDLNTHSFSPLNNVIKQLVYCENSRSVDTVIVNGRTLMKNKQILTFDEEAILDEAKAIGESRRKEWEKSKLFTAKERGAVERTYWNSVRQDVGINRYTSDLT